MSHPMADRICRAASRWPRWAGAGLALLAALGPWIDPVGAQAPPIDYGRQIKPLLRNRCYACHGALKQEAGLRLDTAELVRKGSDSGPVIELGPPAGGTLLQRVAATDRQQRMPPEGAALAPDQIDLLRTWIAQGAVGPADERAEQDPRDHWAFRLPARAALPDVAQPATAHNPLDRFLLARLDAQQLAPRQRTAPELLLRRVYLDLIGLPPTPDQMREFLADSGEDAYERVVEQLLASPLYGQRWARHWMDVWRYSDWYGRRHVPDVWNSAPQIWRWRDWIVDSLNADASYSQMVQAMLAADEIYPGDDRQAVATGYLIRNWFALNPNHWMRENVEHTAKAFLGLTFNCAHCHDHKYDPISQHEYFGFRAFFEPIGIRQDRVPDEADPGKFQEYEYSVLRKINRLGKVSVYDKTPDAPTWFYSGGDERNRQKDQGPILPRVPAVLGGAPLDVQSFELPTAAWYPGSQAAIQQTELAARAKAVDAAERALATVRTETDGVLAERQRELADRQRELAEATALARAKGQATALAGTQSLVLRATLGRRVLTQPLGELKSLPVGTKIQFQLRIVQDAHVNFQLAKDQVKGLTAGMVAFDHGRVLSYQVGGFNEFEIAKYDGTAGQNWFDVEWQLDPPADQCRLTIRDHRDGKLLADRVPVALNGWNPVGDPNQAVSIDARTGSVAAVDDFAVYLPAGSAGADPQRAVYFDFEAPAYKEGGDVVGIGGWAASPFGTPPATSEVTSLIDATGLDALQQKVAAAQRALAAVQLKREAASAEAAATRAQHEALLRLIAADRRRYAVPADPQAPAAIRAAAQGHHEAARQVAEAALLARRRELAAAEVLPESDANRVKTIQAATTKVNEAQAALAKIREQAAPDDYPPLGTTYPHHSTGRRRALAQWIGSTQNPLTARVAANHIWMRHFGTPLVATVFDFGRNGAAPTHPELLDWLAVELMDSGWSMKHVHRVIVTSAAYCQASSPAAPSAYPSLQPPAASLDNRWLWHMNTRRMEAEVVRDSLLYAADQLDTRPGGQELENSEALKTWRRSLYYSCYPEQGGKNDLAVLFDGADPVDCYRRTTSIAPQQALALTNSQLVHELGGQLAARLAASGGTAEEFVGSAFERVLARAPTAAERQACLEFLDRQAAIIGRSPPAGGVTADPVRLARESLVRALFNHNDFVTVR